MKDETEPRDDQPVQEADAGPREDRRQDAERDGQPQVRVLPGCDLLGRATDRDHDLGREDRRQDQRLADRQVEVAGADQVRHPHREDHDLCRVETDREEVVDL